MTSEKRKSQLNTPLETAIDMIEKLMHELKNKDNETAHELNDILQILRSKNLLNTVIIEEDRNEIATSQADGKKSTVSIPQSDRFEILNIVSSFSKNHRTVTLNNPLERKKTQTRF